jgi:uncharacterized membrane protein YhaH (DUF805 family)
VTFKQSIQACFQKYVVFAGRASRSEFWFFFLFQCLASMVATILGGLLWPVVALGLLLPSLAVSARRLQDSGRSPWFLLLYFVPLVGIIVLLVWFCMPGTTGRNQYGEDPLSVVPPAT